MRAVRRYGPENSRPAVWGGRQVLSYDEVCSSSPKPIKSAKCEFGSRALRLQNPNTAAPCLTGQASKQQFSFSLGERKKMANS